VVVVDATNLARNLCLVGEALRYGLPTVVALNMIDLAQRRGLTIDARRLAQRLGCPVLPVMARKGTGCDALAAEIAAALLRQRPPVVPEGLQFGGSGSATLPTACSRAGPTSGGRQRRRRVGARLGQRHRGRASRPDLHPPGGRRADLRPGDGGLFWTLFASPACRWT